jgi:hypothetical protein
VASARERRKLNSDFWSRVTAADALLVRSLWEKSIADREAEVIAAYQDVIEGGGQANEFDSMLGQIKFLATASEGSTKAALERILEVLSSRIPR